MFYRFRLLLPVFLILLFLSRTIFAQENGDWWTPIYQAGMELIEQKQFKAARDEFKKIIKRDKKVSQAYIGLGLSYAAENPESGDAIKSFERAIRVDKNNAEAYYQLGLVYQQRKDRNKARDAFRDALKQDKKYVEAWLALADVEKESGENARVVSTYGDAFRAMPKHTKFYDQMLGAAILYNVEGKAIDIIKELTTSSDSVHYATDLAYLYYVRGQAENSMAVISTIPPDQVNARIYLMQAALNFLEENDQAGLAFYWSAVNSISGEADAAAFLRDCCYLMTNEEYARLQQTPLPDVWKFYYSFWRSRDPNLDTDDNERIPEHYRRLSYARKWYRRTEETNDRRFKLEHPLREHFPVKVGSEMLRPYISDAILKSRDLDDLGLIYVRHGKPYRSATYVDAGDENLPQNLSWQYKETWNHPILIFHFAKWSGAQGWILTSLPVTFKERWDLGDIYLQLDPDRSRNVELLDSDYNQMYQSLDQENVELARIGVQTETSDVRHEDANPLDFPLQFSVFRGPEEGKLLLEVYYGINGGSTLLRPTKDGGELSIHRFIGVYDSTWKELGKVRDDKTYALGLTQREWSNAGIVEIERFLVPAGEIQFEFHLKDLISDSKGIYKGDYVVEDLWKRDSLLVSDVIVSDPIVPAEKPGRFVKEGAQYNPHMFADFQLGAQLGLYFEIYNLLYDAEGNTNFRIICTMRSRGSIASSGNVVGFFKSLFDKDKEVVSTSFDYGGQTPNEKIYMNFDLKGYNTGKYELVLEVEDLQAQKTVRKSVPIAIR